MRVNKSELAKLGAMLESYKNERGTIAMSSEPTQNTWGCSSICANTCASSCSFNCLLTVTAGVKGAVATVGKSGRVTVNTVESGINCCTTPMK